MCGLAGRTLVGTDLRDIHLSGTKKAQFVAAYVAGSTSTL